MRIARLDMQRLHSHTDLHKQVFDNLFITRNQFLVFLKTVEKISFKA